MDPKVAYWTAAFANFTLLTAFAVAGVRHVRRGEVARHRRAMTIAAGLVVAFLVSYPLKVVFLGREDLGVWSATSVGVLRFHEVCVLAMVVGGTLALLRGRRLGRTRAVLTSPDAPAATPPMRAAHRRVGRVAVLGAILGWLSAGLVLAGMFARG